MKPLLAIVGALLFSVLAACQSTEVATVWKSPDLPPAKPFTKVVAIVLNATPGERRAAEDQLASEVRGGRGVAGYSIIPDADLKNREKVRGILVQNGIDGAVVLRLVSSDTQTVYHPPTTSYRNDLYGSMNYDLYSPAYTSSTTVVNAEISIYSVADEKLLWSGSSSTNDPNGIQDLVRQIAKAVTDLFKKEGLMK